MFVLQNTRFRTVYWSAACLSGVTDVIMSASLSGKTLRIQKMADAARIYGC
jgi:hypothetical protein